MEQEKKKVSEETKTKMPAANPYTKRIVKMILR